MSYTNPAKYTIQELKKNSNVKQGPSKNENIVSLDSILQEKKVLIDTEFVDFPHNAKITGVPKQIEMGFGQLGAISVKYDNAFNANKKIL